MNTQSAKTTGRRHGAQSETFQYGTERCTSHPIVSFVSVWIQKRSTRTWEHRIQHTEHSGRDKANFIHAILITVQQDATQSSLFIILQVHCTCFGCQPHPSSAVHKTVTTAYGTVQLPASNMAKLAWPRWKQVAAQKIWPVPEAVVTVLCTPDDGCGWHPKHVQWTCRITNRLLCVASRWTIINICNHWTFKD